MLTTRKACPDDVPSLVAAAHAMAVESDYTTDRFSPRKVHTLMSAAADDLITGAQAFVVEDEGQMLGGAVMLASPAVFSDEIIVSDVGLYVAPEARGRGAGWALIAAIEAWAVEVNASRIHLGITTNTAVERTNDLYTAQGYQQVGTNFRKKLYV